MNIVYLLTNLNKKEEEQRFYIGSKVECYIEQVDSIPTIIDNKTGRPYFGSASSKIMSEELKDGNKFSASILEIVNDRTALLSREESYIRLHDAVNSNEYYNMSYAQVGGHSYDQNAIVNTYGETISEYGKSKASLNNRHRTAKKFGFSNLGYFAIWIYEQIKLGRSYTDIAKEIGWNHYEPYRYIKSYDMDKCIKEYDASNEIKKIEVRKLLSNGASIKMISKLLQLEIPTVCLYVGDFDNVYKRSFLTAIRRGLTKEELEIKITKLILDGMSIEETSKELQLNQVSVKRYFLRCVRARLKSSDL